MVLVVVEDNAVCPICGKAFHLKPSALARYKTHYCSRDCQTVARKEYMKGKGNHQYGLRGDKNPTWSGGTKITRYGYRLVQQIGHPFAVGRSQYVLEHRLVAEKYLLNSENSVEIDGKLYLSPEYIVHHKNGDKLDNRAENLQIMKLPEHQRIHATEQIKAMKRDRNGRLAGVRADD